MRAKAVALRAQRAGRTKGAPARAARAARREMLMEGDSIATGRPERCATFGLHFASGRDNMQPEGCMTTTVSDRIERKTLVRAPPERVWRAITDIAEFSRWFGVEAEGVFTPGARLRMTSTHEGHKGVVFYLTVAEMTPPHTFSWRWHPGAYPGVDVGNEPTTLVTFRLEEA